MVSVRDAVTNVPMMPSGFYPGATSTNDNSLTFRAAGGYRLFFNHGMTAGASLPANGTAWPVISNRNFARVPGWLNSSANPVSGAPFRWGRLWVIPQPGSAHHRRTTRNCALQPGVMFYFVNRPLGAVGAL